MKISIVMATYNRRRFLSQTLPTVFTQDFPPNEYELIVVDDGSTDGTGSWLRSLRPPCPLRVLEQVNRGQTIALNAGIRAATGEWVLFLDDDLLCEPTLLGEHLAGHAGMDPSVVFGPMLVSPDSPETIATQWMRLALDRYYARLADAGGQLSPENTYVGPNCSLARSLLLRVNGYDETLLPRRLEDIELGLRLWKHGISFCYRPQARTYHLNAKSTRAVVVAEAAQDGRSYLRLARKHPDYRVHTPLAQMAAGPGWRRWGRQLAVRATILPAGLLAALLWLPEKLSSVAGMRTLGFRLFGGLRALSLLRGALRESGSWKELEFEYGARLPALLYHRVAPDRQCAHPELTVSPHQFEKQVAWLAQRGYAGIRPSDWLAWCQQGKRLPEKAVLITFDDAYADLAEHAFPVLRKYGFTAAVYVVTGYIGDANRWDQDKGVGSYKLLTAAQIREWASRGIEFGAHSRTHTTLTALAPPRLEEEIARSGDDISGLLGARPISFAYPYGEHDPTAVAAVRNHYALAFTCDEGLNTLTTDPVRLRRTMVLPTDSMPEFACRVLWGHNPVWNARLRLRPRTRLRNMLAYLRGESA
jgi:glycosyltransferase involved in cell wall biosynthesis/peptidoglycan/xylan/chitin deacetylase (PgdA/CDA1 family)